MIIFDLDSALADNMHRLHFIQKPWDKCQDCYKMIKELSGPKICKCGRDPYNWKEDWPAYWDACHKDDSISASIEILQMIERFTEVHIWTGRPESTKIKTEAWTKIYGIVTQAIKMRPEGETCADEVLFEKWLNEQCTMQEVFCGEIEVHDIDMAFSGNPNVIEMWKRRGIPCFQVHI